MQNIKVWETPKVSETDHKGEKPFSRSWERRDILMLALKNIAH